ncbi:hypothetical protein EJD97_014043 [Solanum chilense]|uniref:GH16 domain-containing protein n=1 Tax=Solanum chilense TaxID=4083 RepID=A0A6N2AHJ0_SOLCI|nr:hypothetical protein EJD97_014043 [Solanum chilense]
MVNFQAILVFISIFFFVNQCLSANEVPFYQNYYQKYGGDHLTVTDQGKQVCLTIDQYTGSGFMSNQHFGSGDFSIDLKIPNKNSTGVITTFYLTSLPMNGDPGMDHDEIDFEFLGGDGKYTLNTNIFANDGGSREQQFNLDFDPTEDFHTYRILWNQHHIIFYADNVPIRVFKNNTNYGVNFPTHKMHIEATIWNDTNWVGEVDWSQGPFKAYYRNFTINGCQYQESNPQECYNNNYYWNTITSLSPNEVQEFETVKAEQMIFSYCMRNNSRNFPECILN